MLSNFASREVNKVLSRRQALGLFTVPLLGSCSASFAGDDSQQGSHGLWVGESVIDITPPLGVELAGYHRVPGNERRVKAIRQPAQGRILVLTSQDVTACLVSLDLCAVGKEFTESVRQEIWARYEIPPCNVHVCVTHTHSMPTFRTFRQWGAVPEEFMSQVKTQIVEATGKALEKRFEARLRVGKARAVGASFNRTVPTWQTDEQFTSEASPDTRWLDTVLHVLVFDPVSAGRPVIWYHFSSHPVCYADEQAGPDWCGTVADQFEREFGVRPGFLQGHAGDVNPGSGNPWRGDISQVTAAVMEALRAAMKAAAPVEISPARTAVSWCRLPLDLELYQQWLRAYEANPDACASGVWVDRPFAQAWFEDNKRSPWQAPDLLMEIALLRLGDVAFVFHPAELYSYYGLWIRCQSPVAHTLVVGYANDIIGYLPDPMAYTKNEYAAITVPKILDLPPFRPDAAQVMASRALELLRL